MRVMLFITRGEAGGAQVHVLELVRGLKDEVAFTVGVGEDGFLVGELRALGVPVHVLPGLQRSVSPTSDLHALREMCALIRSVRPDLVHTHSTKAGILGRAAARWTGVPVLHTAHAWSFSDGLPAFRRAMAIPVEALAGRVTHRFLVVSEADRAIALRCRVARPGQVRVIHNGVADTPWRADAAAAGTPTLAMVARLAAPKDHLVLLRALAAVDVPYRLRLIGDGPDRPAVEAMLRDPRLAGRVELVGVSSDVPRLLAEAHIGVLISRQEGFPLAILESMRAGLPVVASDVGGIREAVGDGVTGLLVARGDEAALTAALTRLLVDPVLRGRMGAAGRLAYEARFTAHRMVRDTGAAYRELLHDLAALPRTAGAP